MSIPRYPAYKDSDTEWLGEVPVHWSTIRLDAVLDTHRNTLSPEDLAGKTVFHYSIPAVQACGDGQLEDGSEIDSNKLLIQEPQVLVSKLNPRKGTVCIAQPREATTVGSTEFVPLLPRLTDIRFTWYLVQAESYRARLESLVESATKSHQRTTPSDIRKVKWALPPREEQCTIAAFLDRETTKIDALIAEQQRLIELLQEKRQAVISHAVTKGLNPNAPMKDSGVEWLGEVPEHWEVKSSRYLASIGRGASPRPAGDPHYFGGDFIPWVTVAEITRDSSMELDSTQECLTEEGAANSSEFAAGTVIYSNSGATLGVPKILRMNCCANDGVVGFRSLDASLKPEFLYHFLWQLTGSIREWAKQGQGQPNLNTDIIKSVKIAVPPVDEQADILNTLESSVSAFDSLVNEAVNAQSLLGERRSALISAAVTGQIDVRGLVEAEAGEQ